MLVEGRGDWSAAVAPPPGVEAVTREGEGRKLLFVLNHTAEPKTVRLPAGARDLLGDRPTSDSLELPALGVAVLELRRGDAR